MKGLAAFGVGMGIFFVVAGILMAFFPPTSFDKWEIAGPKLYLLSFVVVIYGAFRIYRALKVLRK